MKKESEISDIIEARKSKANKKSFTPGKAEILI
jgi:hypothetical protein